MVNAIVKLKKKKSFMKNILSWRPGRYHKLHHSITFYLQSANSQPNVSHSACTIKEPTYLSGVNIK